MGEPEQPTHDDSPIENPPIPEPQPTGDPTGKANEHPIGGEGDGFDDVLKMTVYNLVTGKKHFSIKNHVQEDAPINVLTLKATAGYF